MSSLLLTPKTQHMVNDQKGKYRLAGAARCCVALLNHPRAYAFVRHSKVKVTAKVKSVQDSL